MMRCRAWYTDHLGTLDGTLTLEHCRFVLEVGGVRFEGSAPDMLHPVSHTPWAQLGRFDCDEEGLGGCELEWVQPMTLDVEGRAEPVALRIYTPLYPTHDRLTVAHYTFGLEHAGALHQWTHDDFEECLRGLFDLWSPIRGLRCCFTCARSTYLPLSATPPVGGVRCLRGHEAELKWARAHSGYAEQVALHDLLEEVGAPYVAETYVCAHHTRTLEP
jgi:hypothetical protein